MPRLSPQEWPLLAHRWPSGTAMDRYGAWRDRRSASQASRRARWMAPAKPISPARQWTQSTPVTDWLRFWAGLAALCHRATSRSDPRPCDACQTDRLAEHVRQHGAARRLLAICHVLSFGQAARCAGFATGAITAVEGQAGMGLPNRRECTGLTLATWNAAPAIRRSQSLRSWQGPSE